MRAITLILSGLVLGLSLGLRVAADAPEQAAGPAQSPAPLATDPSTAAPRDPAAQSATPHDPAGPPAKTEATAAAADDPVICKSKTEPGTLGRRTKTCMPKSEWDKQREASRKAMKDAFRNSYGGTGRSSGG